MQSCEPAVNESVHQLASQVLGVDERFCGAMAALDSYTERSCLLNT